MFINCLLYNSLEERIIKKEVEPKHNFYVIATGVMFLLLITLHMATAILAIAMFFLIESFLVIVRENNIQNLRNQISILDRRLDSLQSNIEDITDKLYENE
jgi:hypothetical protein